MNWQDRIAVLCGLVAAGRFYLWLRSKRDDP